MYRRPWISLNNFYSIILAQMQPKITFNTSNTVRNPNTLGSSLPTVYQQPFQQNFSDHSYQQHQTYQGGYNSLNVGRSGEVTTSINHENRIRNAESIEYKNTLAATTDFQEVRLPAQQIRNVHLSPSHVSHVQHHEIEEFERPAYQKLYSAPKYRQYDRTVADDIKRQTKKSCCSPCCWALWGLLGLAGIVLGMLFGLGVIGGLNGPDLGVNAPSIEGPNININGGNTIQQNGEQSGVNDNKLNGGNTETNGQVVTIDGADYPNSAITIQQQVLNTAKEESQTGYQYPPKQKSGVIEKTVTTIIPKSQQTSVQPLKATPTEKPTTVSYVEPTKADSIQPIQVSSTAQPVAVQPVAVQPTAIQPVAVQPVAVQPTAIQPTVVQQTTVQPVAIEPTTIEPTTVQPVSVKPIQVKPVSSTDSVETKEPSAN